MKVFVTKYALTDGIQEMDAETTEIKGLIHCKNPGGIQVYFQNKQWHVDRLSAVKRANEMKLKRIASLKKQIEKLEALKFE